MPEKVVLAYSGGLDTSIIIPWLKENYSYDVIAMVGDVGQGDDIEAVVDKAHKTGASKVVVEDLREEFLRGYVFPALKAGAVYEHKYLLGTSLARPVIAKHQVEIAVREAATALAHGCTGKGNDQVRFELAYQALAPELKVIAPWREWNLKSREDCLDYAEKHGIPVTASREKIHSRDRNLWHISHEGGELEDPANAPLPSTWQLTRSPQESPSMRRPVGVKWFLCRSCLSLVSSQPSYQLSPPFHPHSSMKRWSPQRVFSLGASWCSRFSRCCHLIVDLPSHPRWKLGQAINAVTGTRRLGFVLPIGSTTRLPVAWPDCYCAAVHKPPHLPTGDAATPLTFERWPRWLVSFRFSLHARPTSGPSVAGRYRLQTAPECGVHPAPAASADTDLLPC